MNRMARSCRQIHAGVSAKSASQRPTRCRQPVCQGAGAGAAMALAKQPARRGCSEAPTSASSSPSLNRPDHPRLGVAQVLRPGATCISEVLRAPGSSSHCCNRAH